MTKLRHSAILATALLAFSSLAMAEPKHGIAMLGEPALAPGFKSLPYANPDAPQGGQLRQAITGSFDSVNPFIIKGSPVTGVRTYVFESLLGRNWNEPFSLYGLLAETIDVSDDRQTFTFRIRPEAKFSDGTPVTAADVVFSMETLRDKGRPNFKNSYSKITKVETPDEHTVTFHQEAGDRELPLIVGLIVSVLVLTGFAWLGPISVGLSRIAGDGIRVIFAIGLPLEGFDWPRRERFAALAPAVILGAMMGAAVALLHRMVGAEHPLLQLIVLIPAGVVIYLGLLAVFARQSASLLFSHLPIARLAAGRSTSP